MRKWRIFKLCIKSVKNDETNYGPFLTMAAFSKALRNITTVGFVNFFGKHNFVTDAQFGFCKNASSEIFYMCCLRCNTKG